MDYWLNLKALLHHSGPVFSCLGQFVGSDGSLGLRAGNVYALDVYRSGGRLWVHWNGGLCPYDTTEALMRNWRF